MGKKSKIYTWGMHILQLNYGKETMGEMTLSVNTKWSTSQRDPMGQ